MFIHRFHSMQQAIFNIIRSKTRSSVFRYNQCCNTGHNRCRHRSSRLISERTVIHPILSFQRTENACVASFSTRSGNIHPGTIIGISCLLHIITQCRHSHHIIQRSRIIFFKFLSIITGRSQYKTSTHRPRLISVFIHPRIGHKVIYSILQRLPVIFIDFYTPTVITNHSTIISGIFYSRWPTTTKTSHQPNPFLIIASPRDTANRPTIIIFCRNNSCHMRTVTISILLT